MGFHRDLDEIIVNWFLVGTAVQTTPYSFDRTRGKHPLKRTTRNAAPFGFTDGERSWQFVANNPGHLPACTQSYSGQACLSRVAHSPKYGFLPRPPISGEESVRLRPRLTPQTGRRSSSPRGQPDVASSATVRAVIARLRVNRRLWLPTSLPIACVR